VNAEFNVWLLIVGLVVGAGLTWVVMMSGRREEADVDAEELPREAAWLSAVLEEEGHDVSPEAAEELLLLHRDYLGAPPPDPIEVEPTDHAPATFYSGAAARTDEPDRNSRRSEGEAGSEARP
jgi:hypothetical protein